MIILIRQFAVLREPDTMWNCCFYCECTCTIQL